MSGFTTVCGLEIDPARPGYKHAIVKPQPGGELTWAKASLLTPYGELSSRWKLKEGGLDLEVVVPSNTTATIYVPAAEGKTVTEGGQPAALAAGIEAVGWENGAAVYRVGSGSYRFSV